MSLQINNDLKNMVLCIISIFLASCAGIQKNVKLPDNFWQNNHQTVAVATVVLPKPALYQAGQQGLLDVLIADAVTNKFSKHIEMYPLNKDIWQLENTITHRFKNMKVKSLIYSPAIDIDKLPKVKREENKAEVNFTILRPYVHADKLLVIQVISVGATREYYGFIPLGAPKALCNTEGQLIDLRDNSIIWRYTSLVETEVKGPWDQQPMYPQFTQTLTQAISNSTSNMVNDLFSGSVQ